MSDFLNLARPSEQLLSILINRTNNTELTASQMVFSDPTDSTEPTKNTSVVVSGDGVTYVGTQTVHYDRLDLGAFFSTGIVGLPGEFYNVEQALPIFNETFGLALQSHEVKPDVMELDGLLTLEISNSYAYLPNTKVTLIPDFDDFANRLWNLVNYTVPAAFGVESP